MLAAARELLEAGRSSAGASVLRVDLDEAQRADVGRALGLTWVASGRPATLRQLAQALAAGGTSLPELLIAVDGPLRDRPGERARAAADRDRERREVLQQLVDAGLPQAVADLCLDRQWLGPRAVRPQLTTQLVQLLSARPTEPVMLATLAGRLFADTHALDRDTALGRAAQRVLAMTEPDRGGRLTARAESSEDLASLANAASSPIGRREAWTRWGVTCDRLSSTVLVLNVRLPGSGGLPDLLSAAASYGEPVWVTERQLDVEASPTIDAGAPPLAGVTVFVCENPAVVETAADRLGAASAPLVCTYGRPSTAAWLLLWALAAAGASFAVSADRDAAGTSIRTALLRELPRAEDWAPAVAGVYEEERLGSLLDDLAGTDDGTVRSIVP
ncbi:MAG: DUF2399 domain-containing protein [Angustibacter sp.]